MLLSQIHSLTQTSMACLTLEDMLQRVALMDAYLEDSTIVEDNDASSESTLKNSYTPNSSRSSSLTPQKTPSSSPDGSHPPGSMDDQEAPRDPQETPKASAQAIPDGASRGPASPGDDDNHVVEAVKPYGSIVEDIQAKYVRVTKKRQDSPIRRKYIRPDIQESISKESLMPRQDPVPLAKSPPDRTRHARTKRMRVPKSAQAAPAIDSSGMQVIVSASAAEHPPKSSNDGLANKTVSNSDMTSSALHDKLGSVSAGQDTNRHSKVVHEAQSPALKLLQSAIDDHRTERGTSSLERHHISDKSGPSAARPHIGPSVMSTGIGTNRTPRCQHTNAKPADHVDASGSHGAASHGRKYTQRSDKAKTGSCPSAKPRSKMGQATQNIDAGKVTNGALQSESDFRAEIEVVGEKSVSGPKYNEFFRP